MGLQKPAAAGGNCGTAGGYATSLTYNYAWTNPDDIFVENFATTDVQPGTYHLYAYNSFNGSTCTGSGLYRDLGNYTFVAGQTTFIGIWPFYLPEIRGSSQSFITVRNNNTTDTAKVNTSYFLFNEQVIGQRQNDAISPNANLTFAPTNSSGPNSAVVVGTQDIGVVVANRGTGPSSGAYAGIPPSKTDSTFYVPIAARRLTTASGEANSEIWIRNTSMKQASVQITMIGAPNVFGNFTKNVTIPANGSSAYYLLFESQNNLPNGWYGSVVVTTGNSQKIAVTANYRAGNNTLMTFNAFPASSLGSSWKIPLFTARLSNGLNTPVVVQNLSGAAIPANNVTLSCIKDPASPGSNFIRQNPDVIPNNAAVYFNPVIDTTITTGWYGACTVTTSPFNGNPAPNVVSLVQMRFVNCTGCPLESAAAYEALRTNGTDKRAVFPLYQKLLPDGSATAVTIQNLSTSSVANVTFVYTGSGTNCSPTIAATIPAGGSLIHNHRVASGANSVPQLGANCSGSLIVTSSNQPIDGFIQLTNTNIVATGDTFMAHNALTLP